MLILGLRTDKPQAEVYLLQDNEQVAASTWEAHRLLAETLHNNIDDLLSSQNLTAQDLQGIVCFRGPGSFTGLRIGLSVANALAYSLTIPVVGTNGGSWVADGINQLAGISTGSYAMPEYGEPARVTTPKH